MNRIAGLFKSRLFVVVALASLVTIQIYDDNTWTRAVIRDLRRQAAYWVVNQTAALDDAYEYDHAQPIKLAKTKR